MAWIFKVPGTDEIWRARAVAASRQKDVKILSDINRSVIDLLEDRIIGKEIKRAIDEEAVVHYDDAQNA